jgi:hypothetical protein
MFYTCAAPFTSHRASTLVSNLSTSPIGEISSSRARLTLAILGLLAIAGVVLGWNKGQLPQRPVRQPGAVDSPTAPDLQLYREIVGDVHRGEGYYDAAHARLVEHSFPTRSPFNWRLPTYAWLLALLPDAGWIQALLVALSVVALGMAFAGQVRHGGLVQAFVTTVLLFGVVHWAIDGEAFFAQEVWAAAFLIISVSAISLRWNWLAIAAGLAALYFRELALPYCLVACALTAWQRRWRETVGWTLGIALFFLFLGWHVGQVHAQLAAADATSSASLSQWLQVGGLDFILLTVRLNSLLFAAPAAILWLYLLVGLFGLARRNDDTSMLCGLATLAYVAAFAIVGRPWNFYWGLLYAPLLPWGVAHAPAAFAQLIRAARGQAAGETSATEPLRGAGPA